jgi:hypothetical protein
VDGGQQPLGSVPGAAHGLETEKDYVCERQRNESLRLPQCANRPEQPVSREQMVRLLAESGDMLPGFVSRKSGRGFGVWCSMAAAR